MLGKCRGPNRWRDELASGEKRQLRKEQRLKEKRQVAEQIAEELNEEETE